ncbi:MAG: S-layer homology domain-containing protein, partial [Clostridia bacterium]|nr:S-layer homology domain-containing protein [Clostridia bacterium]
MSVKISAKSDYNLKYSARTLPRGATLDETTGEFSWKPTASQIGENLVAIDAVDEYGRISTLYFTTTVYGSTTGSTTKPSTPSEPTTPTIPSTPGASSGGGGGAAPAPSKPETTEPGKEEVVIPETPATTERFIDLGAHAWAKDAINSLADEGIIRGTSENTFAPSANITRADFAILLVRAFKMTSESEENFADVAESDYFAKELAVARNTGLINGIGDNKFAPRNNITRQDMMVIVYRALVAMEKELDTAAISAPDFANVADYAKDAVAALVNAGLANGKSGKIAPTDYTTRAEVAVLLKRILDFIK